MGCWPLVLSAAVVKAGADETAVLNAETREFDCKI